MSDSWLHTMKYEQTNRYKYMKFIIGVVDKMSHKNNMWDEVVHFCESFHVCIGDQEDSQNCCYYLKILIGLRTYTKTLNVITGYYN